MIRRKCCIGVGLTAFGVGLILSVFLQSGICMVLLGLGCIAAGVLCLN